MRTMHFSTVRTACCAAILTLIAQVSGAAPYQYRLNVPGLVGPALPASGPSGPVVPPTPTSPNIELSTSTLDFGGLEVGSRSLAKTISVMNSGTATAAFASIGLSNGASDFDAQTTCGASLAAGQACSVSVVFAPGARGSRSGVVTVQGSGFAAQSISLSGAGEVHSASFDAVAFPPYVAVGTSVTATANLRNTGDGALTVGSKTAAGVGFSVVSSDCPAELAPSQSCAVVVGFTAAAVTQYTGSLKVATGAGEKSAALVAEGATAHGTLTPQTVTDFGTAVPTGSVVSRQFIFSNSGNLQATTVVATVSGSNLAMTSNTCGTAASPVTLSRNTTCSITVAWSPSATSTLAGQLSVSSSADNSPSTLSLTGKSVLDTSFTVNGIVYVLAGTSKVDLTTATNTCANGTFRGTTGWALPAITELNALALAYPGTAPYTSRGWPATSSDAYWSSTIFTGNTNYNKTLTLYNNGDGNGHRTAGALLVVCRK